MNAATVNHEINLALRTAAGHERAALQAEADGLKQYEMKMKSAGASAYAAFVLAAKAAPDLQGRKLDDKAIERLYTSPTRRPWWDEHLAKVKVDGRVAGREWAARTIQWHLDPEAAKARRAKHALANANARKALKKAAPASAHGSREPQAGRAAAAPTTHEMREIHRAAQTTALAGRELPPAASGVSASATREDCLGELNRIRSALGALREGAQFDEALDLLKAVARDLERLA